MRLVLTLTCGSRNAIHARAFIFACHRIPMHLLPVAIRGGCSGEIQSERMHWNVLRRAAECLNPILTMSTSNFFANSIDHLRSHLDSHVHHRTPSSRLIPSISLSILILTLFLRHSKETNGGFMPSRRDLFVEQPSPPWDCSPHKNKAVAQTNTELTHQCTGETGSDGVSGSPKLPWKWERGQRPSA